jgi:hypothetical protein
MLPQTSRTRRATVHDVAIDNLGNTPTMVELSVSDPENALKLVPRPARLTVGPGHAAVARVSVKHRRLLWRGQPVARRFQVTAATPDGPGVALDGTSVQQPVLGKWVFVAVAGLLALALAGAGLWFGLLRPAVNSAASKAGKDAAEKSQEAEANKPVANQGPAGGGSGSGASPSAGAGSNGGNGTGASASAKPQATAPTNFQVAVVDAPGGATREITVRSANPNRFVISYVQLMAPQGDTGLLRILVGDAPFAVHQLANIRDYDTHPTPPIEVPPNKPIRVQLNCSAVGPLKVSTADQCYVNVVLSGTEYKPG